MTTEIDETRVCSLCRTPKPIEDFRLRRRDGTGGRHRECNSCHKLSEKLRRLKLRLDGVDRFAERVADELQLNRVIALADAMVLKLKGPDKLAELWNTAMERAIRRGWIEKCFHHHAAVHKVLAVCGFVQNKRSERGAEK